MALDAAESCVDEDIYNIYKASQPQEFSDNCSSLRAKLITIALRNGWTGNVNDIIPESFHYLKFHNLANPTVSSKQTLASLRDHNNSSYLVCSTPVRLNEIINKTVWTQSTRETIVHHIRKAVALRTLLIYRDVPRGMCNTLQWQIKHFVSVVLIQQWLRRYSPLLDPTPKRYWPSLQSFIHKDGYKLKSSSSTLAGY